MNKKEVIIFRATPLEKLTIKKRAEKCGMSLSGFVMNCIFKRTIFYRLSDDEIKIYERLVNFNNDFERLANHFKHKDSILSNEIRKVAQNIKEELQYIRNGRKG